MVNGKPPSDIGNDWVFHLQSSFQSRSFTDLSRFLDREREVSNVYPKIENVFAAFRSTPFSNVRVVILGQDPYHAEGQAHGLSFSVPKQMRIPPSLRNIFKELQLDLGIAQPRSGDLSSWAQQGVLLLNTVLTVRANEPGSHHGKGWEEFTDAAIRAISDELNGVVFLLWGRPAQRKEGMIDTQKHTILKAPHPSPLSAHRGFIGCGHFGRVNELLLEQSKKAIDWKL